MTLSLFWSLLVQILPLLFIIYLYIKCKYSFWSRRGVAGPRAIFPLGYQFQKALNDPISIEHLWSRLYGKVYGVYTGLIPTLTITDAELIKKVLVKDFHLFMDRRVLNSSHEIWNQNLFNVEAKQWRRIRSIASPTFSSGKLRAMIPLMNQCVKKLVDYMDTVVPAIGSSDLNIKEVITGFTIDVIALTSFATETDANGARSQANAFVQNGLRFFRFNPVRLAAVYALPKWILQWFGIKTIFADDTLEFFVNLSKSVIKTRRRKQEEQQQQQKLKEEEVEGENASLEALSQKQSQQNKRSDLLQLLMDAFVTEGQLKSMANERLTVTMDNDHVLDNESTNTPTNTLNCKSANKKHMLSEKEIIAQCIIFFVAGFETTQASVVHSIFELLKNPVLQERLYVEISAITAETEPESAEYCERILNQAPYLEAVIKETLRMYPPVIRIERRLAVNDYKLGGIPLEKDVLVEIPTVSVHYSPEYYPQPTLFNPDRFMPANKANLVPYTFLPFGAGPRNCIGMRFAYQEIKLCLAQMVSRYHFSPTEGTPERLQFLNGSIMLNSTAFSVKVSRRD